MPIIEKICEFEGCRKPFLAKHGKKKYCCKTCRLRAVKDYYASKPKPKKEQLCWSCKNACGGCSWSISLTPVEGWTATPKKIKCHDGIIINSYKITECPQYISD